jgi:hypothetical protein
MKADSRLTTVLGSLVVLCVAGQTVFGQYPGGHFVGPSPAYGPPALPGYGVPYAAPMGAPAYAVPAQAIPVRAVAPPVAMVPAQAAGTGLVNTACPQDCDDKPAFRVTVVGEGLTERKEASFASMAGPDEYQDDCEADDCGSKGGCDIKACGCVGDCCCRSYCIRVYADYLWLNVRDNELAYAVEANSNLPQLDDPSFPIQVSRVGVLDHDFSSGFATGFAVCLDACSELGVTYTWWDAATSDQIQVTDEYLDPPQIVPMLMHPATQNAISGSYAAGARFEIDFDLVFVDFRRLLVNDCSNVFGYTFGVGWAGMEQNLGVRYADDLEQPVEEVVVATDIDFTAVGMHMGLEAERHFCCRIPAMMYTKGFASLLAGEFEASYLQSEVASMPAVNTIFKADRLVPKFDLELGMGLSTPKGCMRATIGYVFSAWCNMIKNEDWIRAVQTNNFKDLGDTITFDGLIARIEGRF